MKLNFITGKLPLNFYYLGIILLAIGIWRIVVSDILGIPILIVAFIIVLLKWGIIIDTKHKRIKAKQFLL